MGITNKKLQELNEQNKRKVSSIRVIKGVAVKDQASQTTPDTLPPLVHELHTDTKEFPIALQDTLRERETALNVRTIDIQYDNERNAHIIAQRNSDGTFVVWTSYYTREEQSRYFGLYNGTYDLDLRQAVREQDRRLTRHM